MITIPVTQIGEGAIPPDAREKARERRRNRARAARSLAAEKKASPRDPQWRDARRKDDPFVPMPSLTPEQAKALRLQISRSGWGVTRCKVACYLVDLATTEKGQRFRLSGAQVGHAVGISDSKGRYHLRKLVEEGWLIEVEKHTAEAWVDDEGKERFWGIPAVRQLSTRDL